MKSISTTLLVSLLWAGLTHAQAQSFKFTVSGSLVSKLEPDTRVLIWSPGIESRPKWARFSVKDMPVAVPYGQLAARHLWIATFISPSQRRDVLSIGLAPELFDKPRGIDLKLDRPTPRIRPSDLGKLQFQYYAGITQRMWYEELPSWDKKNQKIVAAGPPIISITRVSDGRKLQESAMREGCMGSKWWAALDPSLELMDKTDLQLTVRYDSSGLWEPIETKLNFTYRKRHDGWPENVKVSYKDLQRTSPAGPVAMDLNLKVQFKHMTPTVKWLPKPQIAIPEAEAKSEATMKRYSEVIADTGVQFEMVPIPSGTFVMGSPNSEPGRRPDEGPQHEVRIEPFWMGKCEVTWNELESWLFRIDAQQRKSEKREPTSQDRLADLLICPSHIACTDPSFGMGKDGYPAVCMTHFTAKRYCRWLSAKTGRYYRLPTEAEWEYACRAGTKTRYSFGDDPAQLKDYAWYLENSNEKYQKVGAKKPNPWGLHDMHGNVAEWVLDQYEGDFYRRSFGRVADNSFCAPTAVYPRVIRGGSWQDDAENLRSAARCWSNKDWSSEDPQIPKSLTWHTNASFVGFRVVRPLRLPSEEECGRFEAMEREEEFHKALWRE